MAKFIIQLGRETAISLSEIIFLAQTYKCELNILWLKDGFACVETDGDSSFISTSILGGAIRVIEPIKSESEVIDVILEDINKKSQKVVFGINSLCEEKFCEPRKLGQQIKSRLVENGKGVRFVCPQKNKLIETAAIIRNKVIEKGGEFFIFEVENKIIVGKTSDIQQIDDWSLRDFDKPIRDISRGMLPPKLARIMLNLSGAKRGETILDPFCGVGTIPIEAVILGLSVVASDADSYAVESTKKNIDWILEKFETQNVLIIQNDARDISRRIKNDVHAVVCEPYLGSNKMLTTTQRTEQAEKLKDLYSKSLKDWKKFLKKRARVVIVLPVYATQKGIVSVPIHDSFESLGFSVILPPSLEFSIEDRYSPHKNLLYMRKGQRVLREIVVLEKK